MRSASDTFACRCSSLQVLSKFLCKQVKIVIVGQQRTQQGPQQGPPHFYGVLWFGWITPQRYARWLRLFFLPIVILLMQQVRNYLIWFGSDKMQFSCKVCKWSLVRKSQIEFIFGKCHIVQLSSDGIQKLGSKVL